MYSLLFKFQLSPSCTVRQLRRFSLKNIFNNNDNKHLGELVYNAQKKSLVTKVKAFSITSSIFGLIFQPFIINGMNNTEVLKYFFTGAFTFFIVGTPVLLHSITKSYVIELYYKEEQDQFTAITKGIFLNNKRILFNSNDCALKDIAIPFANVVVKGIPLNFNENDFIDNKIRKVIFNINEPFKI